MSADEIGDLLDEYGIKHGPVVGEWDWAFDLSQRFELISFTGLSVPSWN